MNENTGNWSGKFGLIQEYVLYLLILLIATMVFVQVILRYVFNAPLMGIEEILAFPTIWLYFLGGVNASREKSHIVARVFEVFIKKPYSLCLERFLTSLLSFSISAWLTYWAYDYFVYSLRSWKLSASLYIPMFIGESAVFVCIFLMTLYAVVELFDNLCKLRTTFSTGEADRKC